MSNAMKVKSNRGPYYVEFVDIFENRLISFRQRKTTLSSIRVYDPYGSRPKFLLTPRKY